MKTVQSTLEYAVLGLLKQKPQSGYDLRKTFSTTAMRHYSDSPGSIYPALRRLEARRQVGPAGSVVERTEGRRRAAYEVTAAGETALLEWLEQPVTRDDVRLRRDEMMLRFAFMDGNVPRGTTLRFMEDFVRELEAYWTELAGHYEHMRDLMERKAQGGSLHTGMLAFESGVVGMEAQVGWATAALEKLRGRDEEGSGQ